MDLQKTTAERKLTKYRHSITRQPNGNAVRNSLRKSRPFARAVSFTVLAYVVELRVRPILNVVEAINPDENVDSTTAYHHSPFNRPAFVSPCFCKKTRCLALIYSFASPAAGVQVQCYKQLYKPTKKYTMLKRFLLPISFLPIAT